MVEAGCVGEASSPGISLFGAGRSSTGSSGAPVHGRVGCPDGARDQCQRVGTTPAGVLRHFVPVSRWSAKAEYLYLNLGTIQSTFADGRGLIINNSTKVQDHIFRAGVNYRFSGMPDRWYQ